MSRRRSPSLPSPDRAPPAATGRGGRRPIDPAGRCTRFAVNLPPAAAERVAELARVYQTPASSLLRSLVLAALAGVEVAP